MKIIFVDFVFLNFFRLLSPSEITCINQELKIVAFLAVRREFIVILAILLPENNERAAEILDISVFSLFIPYLVGDTFITHFLDLMLGNMPAMVTEIEILLVT